MDIWFIKILGLQKYSKEDLQRNMTLIHDSFENLEHLDSLAIITILITI